MTEESGYCAVHNGGGPCWCGPIGCAQAGNAAADVIHPGLPVRVSFMWMDDADQERADIILADVVSLGVVAEMCAGKSELLISQAAEATLAEFAPCLPIPAGVLVEGGRNFPHLVEGVTG